MLRPLWVSSCLLAAVVYARHKNLNAPMIGPKPQSRGSPCDAVIPGQWTGFMPQPLNDLYGLAWTQPPSPGAWTATMIQGGGWGTGEGQFSADNLTATISFDSGVNLTGNGN